MSDRPEVLFTPNQTVRWYSNGWHFGSYIGPNPDSDKLANVLYLKQVISIRYDELEGF